MSVFKRWNGTSWEIVGPQISSARFDDTNHMIAPEYSSTNTYNVGDYVVQSNKLYRCTNAIEEIEEWTPLHWTQVAMGGEVSDLNSAISREITRASVAENLKVNKPTTSPDGVAGQLLRTNGDGTTTWANIGTPTDEQAEEAINAWLTAHPEATTTVQDGSLTKTKFSNQLKLETINNYVTPQMYGAVGDGVVDDTQAFQQAIATGKTVYVPEGTYELSSAIQLNTNQKIVGANDKDSILEFNNCDGIIGTLYQDRSGNIIENLFLKGKTKTHIGIKFNTTNTAIIRNVAITGFLTGVELNHSVNNTFYNLFLISNTIGIYSNSDSYYNKLYNLIITACGTAINGSGGNLTLFAVDIEMSSVCDFTGSVNIIVYRGHFEGHGTSPVSILHDGISSRSFYNCDFISYITAFKANTNSGNLIMVNPSFIDCITDFDASAFSRYYIENPIFLTAQGGERQLVSNLSSLQGTIIKQVWSENGYTTDISNFLSAKRGIFNALYLDGKAMKPIKATGRLTLNFGTVSAHTTKRISETAGSGLNAYTDFVILSPTNITWKSGIVVQGYSSANSTTKITIEMVNTTDADIVIGQVQINYMVM